MCPAATKVWLVGTRSAFSVVAPRLWNSLTRDACLARSLAAFRHQVKADQFRWAFDPVELVVLINIFFLLFDLRDEL